MKLSVLLFISLICALSHLAIAEVPLFDESSKRFQQGYWDLKTQVSYFEATANYDKNGGSYTQLPTGFAYQLISVDFGVQYGLSPQWAAFASGQIAHATSKNLTDTRTNSSLTKGILGFNYLLYSTASVDLFPEVSLTFPTERVDTAKDEVLNSERAIEINTQIAARTKWGSFHPFAMVGFTYRDEGRAGLLPYAMGAEYQLSSLKLGAEIRGYQTVLKDKYTSDTGQRLQVASKNGNSLKFYSVDPAMLETNFWLASAGRSDLGWKIGGGTSITGASSAAGWNIFAALSFGLDGNGSQIQRPSSLRPRPQQPKEEVDRFEEEVSDGVNQNLFEKPKPPLPPPPTPAPQKQQRQRKQQIQNDLDRTEFQIELKRMKKKKRSH